MQRTAIATALVLLLGLAAAAVQAQDGGKHTLRYQPAVGQKCLSKLQGLLLDASLQGQSLGVTGDVAADMETEVTARDDEARTTSVKLTLAGVKANLNGQFSSPQPQPPVSLAIGPTGAITEAKADGESNVNFLETGGVPVTMVAVLASTMRFLEAPVAVGEEWQFEDTYPVPGLGEIPISTRWKLAAVGGAEVTVTSTAVAALPDFRIPNPMAPGTEMDVRGGKAYITDLKQVYDTGKSLLLTSEGKLRIDAQLDMQGMNVPVALAMSFTLKPREQPEEPVR